GGGGGQALEESVERGALVDQRSSEVAAKEVADVVRVLHRERTIEPVLLAEQVAIGGRGRFPQEELSGITRHADPKGNDEGHPPPGRGHPGQATTKGGQHTAGSAKAAAPG